MRRGHKHTRTIDVKLEVEEEEDFVFGDDEPSAPRLPRAQQTPSGKFETVLDRVSPGDFTGDKYSRSVERRHSGADVARVLILGTEGSGKSTVFKQMRRFCGDHELTAAELGETKRRILVQICSIVKVLALESIRLSASDVFAKCRVQDKNEGALNRITQLRCDARLRESLKETSTVKELKRLLTALLSDSGVSATCAYLKRKGLFDDVTCTNGLFLLSRFKLYFTDSYQCDFEDLLRMHSERGIYDEVCSLSSDWRLHLTDTPGRRDRRTLLCSAMHAHYSCLLFVAALSDFDQWDSYEQSAAKATAAGSGELTRSNRLLESVELLANVCRLKVFGRTKVVLVLNKQDLFDAKLKAGIAFSSHFKTDAVKALLKSLKGSSHSVPAFELRRALDSEYCTGFLKRVFRAVLPKSARKTLSIYVTCAVATDTFPFVLHTLTQEIKHTEQMRRALR